MIGGEHYLIAPAPVEDSLGQQLERNLGRITFFATGRDALASLLVSLHPTVVHLPNLICASVHDACRAAGKTPETYCIGPDFLHESGLETTAQASSIVFVMHYFGVRNDSLMQQARATGDIIVSDVTHLLLDRAGIIEVARRSDYLIASMRKSGPFPDGGFVSSMSRDIPESTRGLRENFFALRAAGLLSRGFSAAQDFSDDENFHLLKRAEELLDASEPADFACSQLSQRLAYSISVPLQAAAIRRNIAVLGDELRGHCLAPVDLTVVSPYFPCIFESMEIRDRVRSELARHRCFLPVHWPTTGVSNPSPLSDLSLSIPSDARYGEQAMRLIAETIVSCLSK